MNPAANEEFDLGFELGWQEYRGIGQTPDVAGVSGDFELGYWNGVGDAMAWHAGFSAAESGLMTCPYPTGSDDECFRDAWFAGYSTAVSMDDFLPRARG